MQISFTPIGLIHTPFDKTDGMPIQSARSGTAGTVEIFPDYADGLDGVEEFSHVYLLYAFHQAEPAATLKVTPFLDDQEHGIFACRYPRRPNPLGLSVVRLTARRGNRLDFLGADMLNCTPLLDIKPYIPEFDHHEVAKTGWYAARAHQ
jgi:tRNA-Thr(GGU) m(6)t(6)A37 methyltransferase TsaA